jgi:hypothetical protein
MAARSLPIQVMLDRFVALKHHDIIAEIKYCTTDADLFGSFVVVLSHLL